MLHKYIATYKDKCYELYAGSVDVARKSAAHYFDAKAKRIKVSPTKK